MDKSKKLSPLLSNKRIRNSTVTRFSKIDDFYSDRSRILYSSSFRRLQQKAQVFSLEPNASVRTRMTHSLEVADIGRTLSNKIAAGLLGKKLITVREVPIIVAIVENACLLHDIGNPPFGHFGEAAIKDWCQSRAEKLAIRIGREHYQKHNCLFCDFSEFDGNPQGLRTVTKLHTEKDEHGLNLSYATLLCSIKYSRAAGGKSGAGILKKAEYFQSEKKLVHKIYDDTGLEKHTRYPLTYIMEAADDIAYCLSDISDGIEKRIITVDDFQTEFLNFWADKYPHEKCPVKFPSKDKLINFSLSISVPWSKQAILESTENFLNNYEDFFEGKCMQLVPENGIGRVFDTIKGVSRKVLYASIEAESIELTGYAVITGILRHYERLLDLKYNEFHSLSNSDCPANLAYEKRLYNRLGKRYVTAYLYALKEIDDHDDYTVHELWLRIHLLIDHISGMTDEFALNTYQMLEGIELLRT